MSSWKGQSRGTPLGYRIFLWIIRNLGLQPAYFLLRIVSFFFFFIATPSRHALYSFYRNKFGYSFWQSILSIYKNFNYMGEILIDKVALSAGIAGDFDYDNEGEHFIHQFIREGKGCILIGGHIGSWDIAAFFLHIRTKVNVVMYQNEKAQIQAVLDQAKGTNQVNIIPMSNDMSYLIEVKNALDRNEVVCFNADRFIRGDKTMTFHFLGEKAHFPTGVYQIAAKLKSPIACIAGVKKSKRKYQFYCEPIPYKPLTRNKQEDNAIFHGMVKQYVLFFERITRQYPLQWFNHFNFWKANKLRTT